MQLVSVILSITLALKFSPGVGLDTEEHTFMYFAYGSNLLEQRIHLKNKSAKFFSIAVLKGYRLDFNIQLESWNGAVATICEDPEAEVWGALWIMATRDLPYLDRQEGVDVNLYYPKNVTVATPAGESVVARTYIEVQNPEKLSPDEQLPFERRPSITYLKVIYYGAVHSKLPPRYIDFIKKFPTNGKLAPWKRREELGPLFND